MESTPEVEKALLEWVSTPFFLLFCALLLELLLTFAV